MAEMHHLRVVNFDRTKSERNVPNRSNFRNYHNNEVKPVTLKEAENKIEINYSQPRKRTSRPHKHISFRCSSEFFSTYRNNSLERSKSARSRSLDNTRGKQNNSYNVPKTRSRVHRKRLKDNLLNKKYSARFNRTQKQSQDDIKVLYTSERFQCRDDKKKLSKFYKDFQAEKPANKIFHSTGGIHRRNTYLCYQTCRNIGLLPVPKRKTRKTESKPHILHTVAPMSFNLQPRRKPSCNRTAPEHYSLVGFPVVNSMTQQNCIDSPFLQPIDSKIDKMGLSTILVEPLEPSISPCSGPVETFPTTDITQQNDSEQICCEEPDLQDSLTQLVDNVKEFDYKKILMYFLLALVVVAWLPCIIVGGFIWFIVSLITPKETPKCCRKRKRCRCKFKERLISLFEWMMNKVQNCAGVVQKALCEEESFLECAPRPQFHQLSMPGCTKGMYRNNSFKNSANWEPNTGKKYVLSYNNERGWLMKPIKRPNFGISCQRGEINEDISGEREKRGRTVTFWDTQNRASKAGVKISQGGSGTGYMVEGRHFQHINSDQCTQVTCKDAKTGLPTCGKCRRELAAKRKSRDFVSPCPGARPCPSKMRQKIAKLHMQDAKERAIMMRRRKGHSKVTKRESKISTRGRFDKYFDSCKERLKAVTKQVEQQWGGDDVPCGSLYLMLLKSKPCFCVYQRWPALYPAFLSFHRAMKKTGHICLLMLAVCVWCPAIFCCYVCCKLFCNTCCGGCEE